MTTPRKSGSSRGRRWILVVLAFLLFSVGTQVVLITMAVSRPPALMPDYTASPDGMQTVEQRRINADLGWTVSLKASPLPDGSTALHVEPFGAFGKPIRDAEVQVTATHLAHAERRQRAEVHLAADGTYRIALGLEPAGRWEFELRITRDGQQFVTRIQQDVNRETGAH